MWIFRKVPRPVFWEASRVACPAPRRTGLGRPTPPSPALRAAPACRAAQTESLQPRPECSTCQPWALCPFPERQSRLAYKGLKDQKRRISLLFDIFEYTINSYFDSSEVCSFAKQLSFPRYGSCVCRVANAINGPVGYDSANSRGTVLQRSQRQRVNRGAKSDCQRNNYRRSVGGKLRLHRVYKPFRSDCRLSPVRVLRENIRNRPQRRVSDDGRGSPGCGNWGVDRRWLPEGQRRELHHIAVRDARESWLSGDVNSRRFDARHDAPNAARCVLLTPHDQYLRGAAEHYGNASRFRQSIGRGPLQFYGLRG